MRREETRSITRVQLLFRVLFYDMRWQRTRGEEMPFKDLCKWCALSGLCPMSRTNSARAGGLSVRQRIAWRLRLSLAEVLFKRLGPDNRMPRKGHKADLNARLPLFRCPGPSTMSKPRRTGTCAVITA
jgi:hypothetical protein